MIDLSQSPAKICAALTEALDGADFDLVDVTLGEIRDRQITLPAWRYLNIYEALDVRATPENILEGLAQCVFSSEPNVPLIAIRIAQPIVEAHGKAQAFRFLEAVQLRFDTLIPNLALGLALEGKLDLQKTFKTQADNFRKSEVYSRVKAHWQSVSQGMDQAPKSTDISDIKTSQLELFFLVDAPISSILMGRGFAGGKDQGISKPCIDALGALADIKHPKDWLDPDLSGFQDRILRDRNLVIDGDDGAKYQCEYSYLLNDRVIYEFMMPAFMLVVTGGPSGTLIGAILLKDGVAVSFRGKNQPAFREVPMARILANYVQSRPGANAARTNAVARKKVIACVAGTENFAHQIWNSFEGIERIISAADTQIPDALNFYGTEFFGDITDIFPELSGCDVQKFKHRGMHKGLASAEDEIYTNIGSSDLNRAVVDRIVAYSQRRSAQSENLQRIQSAVANAGPVVWLAVRANDKSWTGQTDGFLALMARIQSKYPNAKFLLDGFSAPSGIDRISHKWTKYAQTVDQTIQSIIHSHGADSAVSIHNFSLTEAIAVAQWADFYVAPLGTTQHKIGWFSDAKGVVYASEQWAHFKDIATLPGLSKVPGRPVPRVIFGKSSGTSQEKNIQDNRRNLDEVHLDPQVLIEQVLSIMEA